MFLRFIGAWSCRRWFSFPLPNPLPANGHYPFIRIPCAGEGVDRGKAGFTAGSNAGIDKKPKSGDKRVDLREG